MYKPFLKWVGGKSSLLKEIIPIINEKIKTSENYFEPFCGGGSVFLSVLQHFSINQENKELNFYINDVNKPLINLYILIQKNIEFLLEELAKLKEKYKNLTIEKQKEFYYETRNEFNKTENIDRKSVLLLFLNKTCFRGLYREGPSGFNVPFGNYKNPEIFSAEHLLFLNKVFNKSNIIFSSLDFNDFLKKYESGFVYLDPPYYPLNKTSFKEYTKLGFSDLNLLKWCKETKMHFLQSNSCCEFNLKNYENKFKVITIDAKRRINSKNPKDIAKELLIKNY